MHHANGSRPIVGRGRFTSPAGDAALTIACVGDTCIDENATFGLRAPGGNALNVAVHLRNLGRPTTLFCRLGDDRDGHDILEFLRSRDIGTDDAWFTDDATCHAILRTDPAGRTHVAEVRGKGTPVDVPPARRPRLLGYDVVAMKGVLQVEELLTVLADHGLLSCYDYGTAPEQLRDTAADICIYSAGEGNLDAAVAFVDRATTLGAQVAIATLGADGSVGRSGSRRHRVNASPGRVVDTIGAGDAYFGVLIDALIRGKPLEAAMAAADVAGTRACGHRFAFPDSATPVPPDPPSMLERTCP